MIAITLIAPSMRPATILPSRATALPHPHSAGPTWATMMLVTWWLLCFVDSAWPQAQMAVFGQSVYFGMWPIHLLYLAACGLMILRQGLPAVPASLLVWWAVFGAYLTLSLIFLEARYPGSFGALATTFYRFYFFLMTIPLAFALQGTIESRQIQRVLMLLFVPLAALGLIQHFDADPILPTAAINGTFQIFAWWFQGDIRAFSLFNSGWSFGHFCVFVGTLAIWRYLFSEGVAPSWTALIYLGVAALCTYCALTRTVYLVGLGSLFATIWLERARRTGRFGGAYWLPPLFALGGFMVARGIKDVMRWMGLGNEGIFNSGSLDIRQEAWNTWADVWLGQGLSNALFCAAVTQKDSGQFYGESTVLIDNVFIAIGVQIGLVGVLIWMGFMWVLWTFMLREAQQRNEPLIWAIAAVWSTWPLSLMFGSGGNYYLLLLMLALLTRMRLGGNSASLGLHPGKAARFQVAQQGLGQQAMPKGAQMRVVGHEQVARARAQGFVERQIHTRQPQ